MPAAKFRLKGKHQDEYVALVREFPLASITSDKHLAAAQGVLDRLLAAPERTKGVQTYLDALSDLVAAYENQHHPLPPASDADMLRHFMDAQGIGQNELHRGTGIPRSTISEILAGKRPFSRRVMRRLAQFFRVDVSVLAANV
jgi:HTH-type transcriptional regulator/antitoxin HigA